MGKSTETAAKLALLKRQIEIAEAEIKPLKDEYEQLRKELVSEMVMDNMPQFKIALGETGALKFSLRTTTRWSPIVDNKDLLYKKLLSEKPELFSITAAALTKLMNDIYEANDENMPDEFEKLVKKYDETHVEVRSVKS